MIPLDHMFKVSFILYYELLLRHYIFLAIDRMFFMLYCKGSGTTLLKLCRRNRLHCLNLMCTQKRGRINKSKLQYFENVCYGN